MNKAPVIVWFRKDLRLDDNPALMAAHQADVPIIPLFILDDTLNTRPGAASRWWLHHALEILDHKLSEHGLSLILRSGHSESILNDLVKETGAAAVYWNRRYAETEILCDKSIKGTLKDQNVDVHSYNGSLLREPWEVKTGRGGHYKVYSPFWKSVKAMGPAYASPSPAPKTLIAPKAVPKTENLDDWGLKPTNPNWAVSFSGYWQPGKTTGPKALSTFLNGPINHYDQDRNRPDLTGTSRLSPYLAWGQISPLQIWQTTHIALEQGKIPEGEANKFLSELVWREFAYHLLYFYPYLAEKPLKPAFENYPWASEKGHLEAWQKGMTGYPIVDAGMRELWQTGWMHNRVRMITASFLIKDLLIPWQEGERWFWDTLLDADIANNAASWQWVAGCGADAAPYFRIFNPVTQGEKFDPNGDYVRQFVPEIANLPNKYIHQPWKAPNPVLAEAGITLGKEYPEPIVDHAHARKRALDGYQQIKNI